MGVSRIPGPYGTGARFGCVLNPEPIGIGLDFDGKFPHLTPGPIGPNKDPNAIGTKGIKKTTIEDEDELKLLVKVYGNVKNEKGNKSYVYWEKKTKQYRFEEYVNDRNDFFGSAKAYQDYRHTAHEELEADEGKLRKYIEPPEGVRRKVTDWKKAQDVFYAWVRKAYQKKLGDKIDIPKLIRSQMSEKLKTALNQVKIDYGKSFQYGGFNPRPMKLDGYRLGTISEHAIGTAIDIESAKNPHIPTDTWNNILRFTGKSLDHASRQSKWKTAPKELYDGIKDINDAFVLKLAKIIKDTEEAAKTSAEAAGASDQQKAKAAAVRKDPLGAAVDEHTALKSIGSGFLKQWKNGFFQLPWALVKELHEEGFVWGATFSHPDLHHFEL